VDQAWRGRGLARALKLRAARELAASGIRRLETDVDDSNAPMLAVNDALGYVVEAGHWRLIKPL
jgi:RimJ/RimL family protein N-acetyltransferase